jgi:hypothetical protein
MKLTRHTLANALTFHDKFALATRPTDVGEAKEIKCLGFAYSLRSPITLGKAPKLDQTCFVCVDL